MHRYRLTKPYISNKIYECKNCNYAGKKAFNELSKRENIDQARIEIEDLDTNEKHNFIAMNNDKFDEYSRLVSRYNEIQFGGANAVNEINEDESDESEENIVDKKVNELNEKVNNVNDQINKLGSESDKKENNIDLENMLQIPPDFNSEDSNIVQNDKIEYLKKVSYNESEFHENLSKLSGNINMTVQELIKLLKTKYEPNLAKQHKLIVIANNGLNKLENISSRLDNLENQLSPEEVKNKKKKSNEEEEGDICTIM